MLAGVALSAELSAGSAKGASGATVLESASVSIVQQDGLGGTRFSVANFLGSQSGSGPLLHGAAPPSDTVYGAAGGSTSAAGRYVSVSGEAGLTFAVSRPDGNTVNIEYN
ncbi:hypothetical protein C7C56_013015 [Massilia glaciei]|uniref:Uncharacterized protein n=1 Tax=Massilia glaciei TaxID=1524097 RepID=A0A2U2HKJ9_9BURK|nr:hypothetical protein C7C56_013015 [Massilia glaciei]